MSNEGDSSVVHCRNPECKAKIQSTARFCSACGSPQQEIRKKPCILCQNPILITAQECIICSAPQNPLILSYVPRKQCQCGATLMWMSQHCYRCSTIQPTTSQQQLYSCQVPVAQQHSQEQRYQQTFPHQQPGISQQQQQSSMQHEYQSNLQQMSCEVNQFPQAIQESNAHQEPTDSMSLPPPMYSQQQMKDMFLRKELPQPTHSNEGTGTWVNKPPTHHKPNTVNDKTGKNKNSTAKERLVLIM